MTDPAAPPWLHLISAFLAMETSDSLVSIARLCGDGSVTERVQRFIWNYCITRAVGKGYDPYLRNFLKKLIVEVESSHGDVLDEIYEKYADIITSLKVDQFVEKSVRVCKTISFLFPEGCIDIPSCPKSRKLMVPLQCSLNMFEGDTGCSIWPASLLLSEFILSFPEIFSNKSCFEVGSGVGLVGICLAHVKASKVTLTDGDLLTLSNMRSNLELNQLSTATCLSESFIEDPNVVECVHLPWESASESEICVFKPDIILGADVIYDRSCFPDLVRVLAILLNARESHSPSQKESSKGYASDIKCNTKYLNDSGVDACSRSPNVVTSEGSVAYIATVIRNIDTFDCFLSLAEQTGYSVVSACVIALRWKDKTSRNDSSRWTSAWREGVICLVVIAACGFGAGLLYRLNASYILLIVAVVIAVLACAVLCFRHGYADPPGFSCPWVPILPAVSIFFNLFLFAQLHYEAWWRFVILSFISICLYAFYGQYHADPSSDTIT